MLRYAVLPTHPSTHTLPPSPALPCLPHRGIDVMDLLITLTTGRGVALLNSTQV